MVRGNRQQNQEDRKSEKTVKKGRLDLLKALLDLRLNISKLEVIGYADSNVAARIVVFNKWSKFCLVFHFCKVLSSFPTFWKAVPKSNLCFGMTSWLLRMILEYYALITWTSFQCSLI